MCPRHDRDTPRRARDMPATCRDMPATCRDRRLFVRNWLDWGVAVELRGEAPRASCVLAWPAAPRARGAATCGRRAGLGRRVGSARRAHVLWTH
eukprot:5391239-Prymnesium_polylepis.1